MKLPKMLSKHGYMASSTVVFDLCGCGIGIPRLNMWLLALERHLSAVKLVAAIVAAIVNCGCS